MRLSLFFTPEAEDQLVGLYRDIAAAVSAEVAARYTDAIVAYCEELAAFPHRGRVRDDIRPGLVSSTGWHSRLLAVIPAHASLSSADAAARVGEDQIVAALADHQRSQFGARHDSNGTDRRLRSWGCCAQAHSFIAATNGVASSIRAGRQRSKSRKVEAAALTMDVVSRPCLSLASAG